MLEVSLELLLKTRSLKFRSGYMKTWLRAHFDTAEHTRDAIAAAAVVAGAISLILFIFAFLML